MSRSDKSLVNLAIGGGLAAAAATFFLRPDTLFLPEPRPKKRGVADPAKKRQRKAQRTARRINRKG